MVWEVADAGALLLAAQWRQIEVVVGAQQQVGTAAVGRVGVKDLVSVPEEHAETVLLALGMPRRGLKQLLLVAVVVLDRGDVLVQRDVKVVVEVAVVGGQPRKGP